MFTRSVEYHRMPIRAVNTLVRGLNRLGLARISLDPDELIETAQKQTGLTEFGDIRFIEPMKALCRAFEEEADLNPLGRFMNRANILRILKHRLLAEDLIKRHPEILERSLPDPVVVVGLARSGTTRLHRLLAADDRFVHVKSWESMNPVPYPESFAARDRGKALKDPRVTMIEQGLKAVLYMSPQIAAVHPLGTFEVEEELGLIQHSFASQLFEIQAYIPSFAERLMTHDQSHAYDYMLVLMKIISWYRNDPPEKPWILKTPQYMQDLDQLIRIFPGARLICPHRDPVKVIASLSSLTWNAIVRDSDTVRHDWIGREWLKKSESMLKKTLAIRDQLPLSQQYDVQYADITADWRQAMQGIYDFLNMPFTRQAEEGMLAWLDENARHKHGMHKYELEDFGLTEEQVDQTLMFYRKRFNIPYETVNPHTGLAN